MSERRISSVKGPSPAPTRSGTSARLSASPRWRDIQFVEFEGEPQGESEAAPEPAPVPVPLAPTPVAAVAVPTFRIAANRNDPLPKPEPAATFHPAFPEPERPFPPAPPRPAAAAPAPRPKGPRYGRAIAPLPAHLIASVPLPPRVSLPPAPARLRPIAPALGKSALFRGTPFGPRRGTHPWRNLLIGLGCLAAAVIVSWSGFVAGLFERIGTPPPRDNVAVASPAAVREPPVLPVAISPPQAEAATEPATSAPPGASSLAPASPPGPSTPAPAAAVVPVPGGDRLTDLTIKARAGDTSAEYDVGVIFARGDGVNQDYAKAAGWFREAAINGHLAAQYNLAVLYERGLGVPQNTNEALIWYHSAAARNYPSAQYNLAISYAQGHGTPQDMVSAARWYLRAARQGVVAAMVNFAILCEGGQGTDKSPNLAYAWYRAAGARGDEDAAKRAGELYRQFPESGQKAADAAALTAEALIREPLSSPAPPAKSAATRPSQNPG